MPRTLNPFTQKVLDLVRENPGITSREVAEFTLVDSAYVQKTLNNLRQQGYIYNTRGEGVKAWVASGTSKPATPAPAPKTYESYVPGVWHAPYR